MAGFITAEGIVVPAGSDTYDYVNDQRREAASIRSIVPCNSDSDFANVVAGMAADGRPVTDANPLFAYVANDGGMKWQGTAGTMLPLGASKPFGHMGKTAGFQTIASTTALLCTMTAGQDLQNGMTFDASTSSLVVPIAGRYMIIVSGYATGSSAYSMTFLNRVNAVMQTQRAHMNIWKGNTQDFLSTAAVVQPLNAGDKVSVWANTDTAGIGSTWGTTGYDGLFLEVLYWSP